MMIKEAKQQLQKLIIDRGLILARKSDIVGDSVKEIYRKDLESLKTALSALEKQVPKKVKKEFVTVNGCITCFETDVCPVCGNVFYIEDLGQTMYYSFCPDCGQALDWSETDD